MNVKAYIISIFVTGVFLANIAPLNAIHHSKKWPQIFPIDTILFNDTLAVSDTLYAVSSTLLIRNIIVDSVNIDGRIVTRQSTIAEYFILPYDTFSQHKQPKLLTLNKYNDNKKKTIKHSNKLNGQIALTQPQVMSSNKPFNSTKENLKYKKSRPLQKSNPSKPTPVKKPAILSENINSTPAQKSSKPWRKNKLVESTRAAEPLMAYTPDIPKTAKTQEQGTPKGIKPTTKSTFKINDTFEHKVCEDDVPPRVTRKETSRNIGKTAATINIIVDNNKVTGTKVGRESHIRPGSIKPVKVTQLNIIQPSFDKMQEVSEATSIPKSGTTKVLTNTTIRPANTISGGTTKHVSSSSINNNTSNRFVIERHNLTLSEAYQLTISSIETQRRKHAEAYKNARSSAETAQVLKNAAQYLEEAVGEEIIYFWYGTRFDRNGTFLSPEIGKIPCSYFAVTMLMQAGMKADRTKLSQQNAQTIAKILGGRNNLQRFSTRESAEKFVKEKGRGLYVIGFDTHVGFLYNNGHNVYLIHSTPSPPNTVARHPIQSARSFDTNDYYDIAKISDNTSLIQNWLLGKQVNIMP